MAERVPAPCSRGWPLATLVLGSGLASGPLTMGCSAHRAEVYEPSLSVRADEQRAIDYARWLLDQGRIAEARDRIKQQRELFPESDALPILLGVAYLKDKNPFWAINTLSSRIEAAPGDCDARVWLAWTYLQIASLDKAREAIDHASCRSPMPVAARAALLRAIIEDAAGNPQQTRTELANARQQPVAWPADRQAMAVLLQKVEPDRIAVLAWQTDVRRGTTSNALLGSPIDPSASHSSPASSFAQVNGWLRWSPELRAPVRPSLELQARVFQLFARDVQGQSYINPTGRAGVMIGERIPRVLVGYRPDALRLSGGDAYNPGPLWYVSAHLGEVELEAAPWLLVFVGAGRRTFRAVVRTRTEFDGGVGGQSSLANGLGFIWALSGRKHWSDNGVYDLMGTTGLGNLQYTFGLGWQARTGLTLAADWYPHSAQYFGEDQRRDFFVKIGGAFFSPAYEGLRSGVAYDYSHRDSTAAAYQFADHRVTLQVAWSGVLDTIGPASASSRPVAEIPWGLGQGRSGLKERVQELLRQDEQTLQRSCGCRE